MSSNNISSVIKSCSEGELVNETEEKNMTPKQIEGSRLKRTFTLPRNPFGTAKIALNKPKTKELDVKSMISASVNDDIVNEEGNYGRKLFRRPSWRRFINKIAQHMNSVAVPGVKNGPSTINGERVPISGEPPWPPGSTPAATGLRNHGNTCFMNAVLQCLSHTDIIAEYFVLDHYKLDLLKRNKINSKKYGTKGEVTEQLASILKALWACQYSAEMSIAFKAAVERHGTQYRGNSQHDAQEFLFWLLDKVHEDLNTATKKKYKTIKNNCGKPDEVVAAETLANHARRNSSFVQAVFQAQYRSALTCGRCRRTSCTFDPFHCVSVQLPPRPEHPASPLPVTVLYVNQQPRQVRIGVEIAAGATMSDLKRLLHTDTGVKEEDIVIAEISSTGWQIARAGSEPAGCDAGRLYCVEAPALNDAPSAVPAPYVLLLWINMLKHHDGGRERFGSPYAMQVPRETSYQDMQKLMLKEMAGIVSEKVLVSSQPASIFRARIADLSVHECEENAYLQPELPHPLYAVGVEQVLAMPAEGPAHLKLELEWLKEDRDAIISDVTDACETHSSAVWPETGTELEDATAPPLTLHACLAHYTRAETLAMEDAWRCPQCQQYMPVVKTLGLWSLPDILVIHLKRFRQHAKCRTSTKLTTMVDFPLNGFDMTPHLVQRRSASPAPSPRRRTRVSDNLYDLYAVCYHHGDDLETGHYTAACKNPYDGNWYKFDDAKVTRVPDDDVESELVNNTAYILFYQRRKPLVTHSNSSLPSGVHWALRMPRNQSKTKADTIEVPEKDDVIEKTTEVEIEVRAEDISETRKSSLSQSATSLPSVGIADQTSPNSQSSGRNNSTKLRSSCSDINMNGDEDTAQIELNGNGEIVIPILVETYSDHVAEGPKSFENSIHLVMEPYAIHKDVHVNPKMTSYETLRPKSVDYPKSGDLKERDMKRNYESSPFVSSINGLEYGDDLGNGGAVAKELLSRAGRLMNGDQVRSASTDHRLMRFAKHTYPRETASNVC